MKKILHIFILFFAFTMAQAQTTDDKAKAYYQEAQKAFESRNYKQTIDYCKQVTDLLKTTNSRVELLRIKSYYELGEYDKAKASIKTFTNLQASDELKNEALEYLVKVEKVEKAAEEKRLAEHRRLEQERIAKEQRLAEEKRQKEEAERERLADENRRKAEEKRREERGLLLKGEWKGVYEYVRYWSYSGDLHSEKKGEIEIEIEEKGNLIKLTDRGNSMFVNIEAKLVSEDGDKKVFEGSVKHNGWKNFIKCTYNKKDKTLYCYLERKDGATKVYYSSTFEILY